MKNKKIDLWRIISVLLTFLSIVYAVYMFLEMEAHPRFDNIDVEFSIAYFLGAISWVLIFPFVSWIVFIAVLINEKKEKIVVLEMLMQSSIVGPEFTRKRKALIELYQCKGIREDIYEKKMTLLIKETNNLLNIHNRNIKNIELKEKLDNAFNAGVISQNEYEIRMEKNKK